MRDKLSDNFCWRDTESRGNEALTDSEKYKAVVDWSYQARCQNPTAFDKLTEWLLDSAEWDGRKACRKRTAFDEGNTFAVQSSE